MEALLDFRKRLKTVHTLTRLEKAKAAEDELTIDADWRIAIAPDADEVTQNAAADLQDYFKASMNVSLTLAEETIKNQGKLIIINTDKPEAGEKTRKGKIICDGENIRIFGTDARMTLQACHALEKILNKRRGPYVKSMNEKIVNRFSPRMVHSGWGLDVYPENYLNAISHAGFDSILVFYSRKDAESEERISKINQVIGAAAKYGVSVYLYFDNWRDYDALHPEDPEAEAYYDNFYGKAFANHPGAVGCVMVGESCAFPSRDPNVSALNENIKDRPQPGWWPCCDYPAWLDLVKKVVRRQKADADLVFWTYNWGWAPEERRLELINNLPEDITLLVTFEMFEKLSSGDVQEICSDYTIKFEGPGYYFTSEAEAAKKKNIKLYSMTNTSGLCWDFGVVPYVPVPFQWAKRWRNILEAQEKWGLCGLMESHHYGCFPSYMSDVGEYFNTSMETDDLEGFLKERLMADFGGQAAEAILKAWKLWSDSFHLLPATAYDQYGPLRVGPSYPFYLSEGEAENLPSDPNAKFGSRIVVPFYAPDEFFTREKSSTPIDTLVRHELKSVKTLLENWRSGVRELETAQEYIDEHAKDNYDRLLALGQFIEHTLRSVVNIKSWWILRKQLEKESSSEGKKAIYKKLAGIAENELENARKTIDIVSLDSRLGWEPSMGYLTDKKRLSWKIEALQNVLEKELTVYMEELSCKTI